jgi:hypothetical protein
MRSLKLKFLALVITLLWLGSAQTWASAVYSISDSVGGVLFVNGSITTDGALGTLSAADITEWDLTLTGNGTFRINSNNSQVSLVGNNLTSTASALVWDFISPGGTIAFSTIGFPISTGEFHLLVGYTSGPSGQFFILEGFCPTGFGCGFEPPFQFRTGVEEIANATPLPATFPLFLTGLGALALIGRKRQK